jgi:hypothetical protein
MTRIAFDTLKFTNRSDAAVGVLRIALIAVLLIK